MLKQLLIALLLSLVTLSAHATGSVMEWLALIDEANYAESWAQSDQIFRSQVRVNEWEAAMKQTRAPLGDVLSRSEKHVADHASLPGLGNGQYRVIQYDTSFTNKKTSTETVTLTKGSGEWRVIGYFIR